MLKLHETAELIPAPGLLLARLSNYWGHKLCNAGTAYMAYVESGDQPIDLNFLDEANTEINHVFGFEKLESPTVTFNKYLEGFLYCFQENKRTACNPPYDSAQTIDEIIAFRRNSTFTPKKDESLRSNNLSTEENKMLDLLTIEFSQRGQQDRQQKKEDVLKFVAGEVAGRITMLKAQAGETPKRKKKLAIEDNKVVLNDIWTSADDLDKLMSQADQERILGECYKEHLTDEIIRSGVRGAYATACANLTRAMWSPDEIKRLSGVFYDMQESWHFLMQLK